MTFNKHEAFAKYLSNNLIIGSNYGDYISVKESLDRIICCTKLKYYETVARKLHESTGVDFFTRQRPSKSRNRNRGYQFICGVDLYIKPEDVSTVDAIAKTAKLVGFEKALILFRRQI